EVHGSGSTAERLASFWHDLCGKVEVALPQGLHAIGEGWSWFEYTPGMSGAELARIIGVAEERLWRAIAVVAHGRKVIVAGFSQGGHPRLRARRAPCGRRRLRLSHRGRPSVPAAAPGSCPEGAGVCDARCRR